MPYRWIVRAGEPFAKDKKIYIPIYIIGEPLRSRSLIVRYLMNLELLRISSDYYQYNTQGFETIWPFILYLFNNWVRHQVMMMNVADNKPLFGPDEFMAPNPLSEPLPETAEQPDANIHANDYSITGEALEIDKGLKEAKHEYDEVLNFSSEIEYDERFDYDEFRKIAKPGNLLDKSAPEGKRKTAIELFQSKRKELFQAYRLQLQDERRTLMNA